MDRPEYSDTKLNKIPIRGGLCEHKGNSWYSSNTNLRVSVLIRNAILFTSGIPSHTRLRDMVALFISISVPLPETERRGGRGWASIQDFDRAALMKCSTVCRQQWNKVHQKQENFWRSRGLVDGIANRSCLLLSVTKHTAHKAVQSAHLLTAIMIQL